MNFSSFMDCEFDITSMRKLLRWIKWLNYNLSIFLLKLLALLGTRKVLRKEKRNTKKNNFLMFDFTREKSNIIKISQNFTYREINKMSLNKHIYN